MEDSNIRVKFQGKLAGYYVAGITYYTPQRDLTTTGLLLGHAILE